MCSFQSKSKCLDGLTNAYHVEETNKSKEITITEEHKLAKYHVIEKYKKTR